MDAIEVRGARVHNLKNIDVDIPRGKLVVITGLSGSGKSSLAFDTIYAEGQRRYVESLSVYARQFLGKLAKPDVDSIEGLSPAIAIEQRQAPKNPRSTVGTITELLDYLRLLLARVGAVHCFQCGRQIRSQTVQQIVDMVLALPDGERFSIIAPTVRDRRGAFRRELLDLRKSGYYRVAIDGDIHDLSVELPALDRRRKHTIDVYVDRLVNKDGIRQRLTDSVELALRLADGLVVASPVAGEPKTYSERFACIECGISYPTIEPRMFSFNSPHGACPGCDGLGVRRFFDRALIVPDHGKSLQDGAIEAWQRRNPGFYRSILDAVCQRYAIATDVPFSELDDEARRILFEGSGEDEIEFVIDTGKRVQSYTKPFEGIIANLQRRLAESEKKAVSASDDEVTERAQTELLPYLNDDDCDECDGTRLRRESRHVSIGGQSLPELTAMPLDQLKQFFEDLELDPHSAAVVERLLREVRSRLGFLVGVGVGYLSLDRPAATLSSGEAQRIRLATQIGSSLVGVLYVLDEPSIGLHPRDNHRLLRALERLRDLGNSVLIVEHDPDTIRASDFVVDLGPRAGVHGGHIVASGTPDEIAASSDSLTGLYLSGKKTIEIPQVRRTLGKRWLEIEGASVHNLQQVSVRIPIGALTCVTGVSGSGKSSLIMDTLLPALAQKLGRSTGPVGAHSRLSGAHYVDRVVAVDQAPIGRTPRSNPATYTGVLTILRQLFAGLPESKMRGYKAGRYSFNVKGGRCESCQGEGTLRIEMNFLPDVFVTCEACAGRRYNRETLDVRYRGFSIADMLDMTVEQALDVLINVPQIRSRLESMRDVGLSYLSLGQSATTLSGGEAQRLKLSRELGKRSQGRTLYILDEPTTGLHFDDVRQLLHVLNLLVDQGNSVVVIEHNLDVIKVADYIIDMGPEGGNAGGCVVATGSPAKVAAHGGHTAVYLRRALGID